MRFFLCLCFVVIIQSFFAARHGAAEEITIGVRVDTPPFASIDRDSGAYVGYFYKICIEAVTRAGYQFNEEPVDATKRNSFLTKGDDDFDLLCDPTTITLSRMENFAALDADPEKVAKVIGTSSEPNAPHLDYSQIVFVANGGYVTASKAPDAVWQAGIEEQVGVEEKVAEGVEPSVKNCLHYFDYAKAYAEKESKDDAASDQKNNADDAEGEPFITFRYRRAAPSKAVKLLGYVVGSTIGEKVFEFSADTIKPVPCTLPSHTEAAAAFCSGKLHRYYGDLDIIRASIADYVDKSGDECNVQNAPDKDLTYEPYAFVISSRVPEFQERFACALYSMFEDKSMEQLFQGQFSAQKSTFLETLFAINSIPSGRREVSSSSPHVCGIVR